MKTTREFIANGDRYAFDFNQCSSSKGWAQVDTSSDAWYFGNWANPKTLKIFGYCEGDATLNEAASVEEFVAELRAMDEWYLKNGGGKYGIRIDTCLRQELDDLFTEMGLADLLY